MQVKGTNIWAENSCLWSWKTSAWKRNSWKWSWEPPEQLQTVILLKSRQNNHDSTICRISPMRVKSVHYLISQESSFITLLIRSYFPALIRYLKMFNKFSTSLFSSTCWAGDESCKDGHRAVKARDWDESSEKANNEQKNGAVRSDLSPSGKG